MEYAASPATWRTDALCSPTFSRSASADVCLVRRASAYTGQCRTRGCRLPAGRQYDARACACEEPASRARRTREMWSPLKRTVGRNYDGPRARPSQPCDRRHSPVFRSTRVLVSHKSHPSHPHPSTFSSQPGVKTVFVWVTRSIGRFLVLWSLLLTPIPTQYVSAQARGHRSRQHRSR